MSLGKEMKCRIYQLQEISQGTEAAEEQGLRNQSKIKSERCMKGIIPNIDGLYLNLYWKWKIQETTINNFMFKRTRLSRPNFPFNCSWDPFDEITNNRQKKSIILLV